MAVRCPDGQIEFNGVPSSGGVDRQPPGKIRSESIARDPNYLPEKPRAPSHSACLSYCEEVAPLSK